MGITAYRSWRSASAHDAEWMSGKSRPRVAPVLTEASSWMSLPMRARCRSRRRRFVDKRFDLVPPGIDERATEHSNQPFGGSRMREDRIAQRGIRKPTQHRDLNGGHHLARLGTEYREAENPILGPDQGLGESSRLGQGAGAQHGRHRLFGQ